MEKTLLALPEGVRARVGALDIPGEGKRRLMDLGFTPGTPVECLFSAPSGDPRAYLVRGTVIALRDSESGAVKVTLGAGDGLPL